MHRIRAPPRGHRLACSVILNGLPQQRNTPGNFVERFLCPRNNVVLFHPLPSLPRNAMEFGCGPIATKNPVQLDFRFSPFIACFQDSPPVTTFFFSGDKISSTTIRR